MKESLDDILDEIGRSSLLSFDEEAALCKVVQLQSCAKERYRLRRDEATGKGQYAVHRECGQPISEAWTVTRGAD